MGWARLDDGWHDHRKVAAVGLEAAGLWVMCLTWAHKDRRSSKAAGVVPDSVIGRFAGRKANRLSGALFEAGLFDAKTEQGWPIHDFDQYLPKYDSEQARLNGSSGGKAKAAKQTASKPLDESEANEVAEPSTRASARRNPEPVPVPSEPTDVGSAQHLVGEWIDHCAKRPPDAVIGQVSKSIKQLLEEGIDPSDVRDGLQAWHRKALHPATLPSVVNEVMQGGKASTTDARLTAGLELAEKYRAEEAANAQI